MEHLAPLATMATINGDNGCSIVANGDSVSGANGDHNRHWRPLAPFKWRHLIHSMAILSSQSPFRVSGSFGDPMAPIDPVAPLTTMASMAIHLRQWCNGDNGANSDDGDPLVPMATMVPMAPMTSMATMVQNLIMTAALATMVQMAPMAIVIAIGTTHRIAIPANGTAIVAIGIIGAIGAIITNGSP